MFIHSGAVQETIKHFGDDISSQVLRKIIEDIGYTDFFAHNISITSDYRTGTKSSDRHNNPNLRRNRVVANSVLNLNPNNNRWLTSKKRLVEGYVLSAKNNCESIPILYDTQDGIIVTEYLRPTMLTMNIRFELLDKSVATDLYNRLSLSFSNGEMHTVADVQVEYPIPGETFNFWLKLLRLKGIPANQYLSYLRKYSSNQVSMNVTRFPPNRDLEPVIKRQMANLYVGIEMSGDRPSPVTSGVSVVQNVVEITAFVQFSRTDLVMTHYPPVINNALLPEDMVPGYIKADIYHNEQFKVFDTYAESNYLVSGENGQRLFPIHTLVKLPYYDPWKVPTNSTTRALKYNPILTMITTLDHPEQLVATTDIDLVNGIPEHRLAPEVLTVLGFVKGQALYPMHRYYIQVFCNDRQIEPTTLSFDGTVLKIPNRDTTKIYRIVISKNPGLFLVLDGKGGYAAVKAELQHRTYTSNGVTMTSGVLTSPTLANAAAFDTTSGSYLSNALASDAYTAYNNQLKNNGGPDNGGCSVFRILTGDIVTSAAAH